MQVLSGTDSQFSFTFLFVFVLKSLLFLLFILCYAMEAFLYLYIYIYIYNKLFDSSVVAKHSVIFCLYIIQHVMCPMPCLVLFIFCKYTLCKTVCHCSILFSCSCAF